MCAPAEVARTSHGCNGNARRPRGQGIGVASKRASGAALEPRQLSTEAVVKAGRIVVAIAALAMASGCSTWDSMSGAQKGTVIGAGAGGAVGAAATSGGVLGTVGGAAAGGLIGHEVDKRRDR
jgi:osmotically inducible lipoprotein OsmB